MENLCAEHFKNTSFWRGRMSTSGKMIEHSAWIGEVCCSKVYYHFPHTAFTVDALHYTEKHDTERHGTERHDTQGEA
eukprot:1158857-Pelagomonas_calceolata.AAC.5